jgi:acyl carrier protein
MELRQSLKQMVIDECNVKGATPSEIADTDPLIGGFGVLKLDSLDAVEIATALERHFGIKLESVGVSRQIFKSFNALSDYIEKNASVEVVSAFKAKYR